MHAEPVVQTTASAEPDKPVGKDTEPIKHIKWGAWMLKLAIAHTVNIVKWCSILGCGMASIWALSVLGMALFSLWGTAGRAATVSSKAVIFVSYLALFWQIVPLLQYVAPLLVQYCPEGPLTLLMEYGAIVPAPVPTKLAHGDSHAGEASVIFSVAMGAIGYILHK